MTLTTPPPSPPGALELADLRHLAHLARAALGGARVRRVRCDPDDPRALSLLLRHRDDELTLLIDLRPHTARMQRVRSAPRGPTVPPAFIMLLRKYLDGTMLVDVRCADDDRRLVLVFATLDERWTLTLHLAGRCPFARLARDDDGASEELGRFPPRARDPVGPAPPARLERAGDPELAACADFDAASAWLDARYTPWAEALAFEARRTELARRLRQTVTRLERRLVALARDLDAVDSAPALRHEADLLSTHRALVPRGASEVEVPDWLAENTPRALRLDPARPLADQIEDRYRKARRLERGADAVLTRIDATERRLRELAAHVVALDAATSMDDLDPMLASLPERVIRSPRDSPQKGGDAPRAPWHTFASSDGLPIFVGRTSRDNDRLTFQHARGNDVWMHVEDGPGSHVIVRTTRGVPVPRRTLEEAAMLAVHFSSFRDEAVVSVRYTERKHVRKAKGAGPGRVTVAGAKSIDIRVAPDRLNALLDQGRERV